MKIKRVIETEEGIFYEGDIIELETNQRKLIGRIAYIDSDYIELDCSERFKAIHKEIKLKDFYSIKHYMENVEI